MDTRETKKIAVRFGSDDMRIISRLITEQVVSVTISELINGMSCVFGWYKAMFTLISKISSGMYVELDRDEINVLVQLISKAYNNDDEPEKEAIKAIADTIDILRK